MAEEETAEGLINPLFFFQKFDEVIEDKTILIGDGGDFVATCAYIVQPKGPYTWLDPVFLEHWVWGWLCDGCQVSQARS